MNMKKHPRYVTVGPLMTGKAINGIIMDTDNIGITIVTEDAPNKTAFIPYTNISIIIKHNENRLKDVIASIEFWEEERAKGIVEDDK